MWKELANVAQAFGGLPLQLLFVASGLYLFIRIADKKNNDMPRDTRKLLGKWGGRLIAAGLIIAGLTFILKAVAEYVPS